MTLNEEIVRLLKERHLKVTTMESCTSGSLISTITDSEGASSVTEGGFVTYSNNAKINAGVDASIINKYGVYSFHTASEMASVCKELMQADIGIGVTGTLSNVDENNPDSKQGVVFYAIDFNDVITEEVKVPVLERCLQKQYIVDVILSKLLEVLTDGEKYE